MNYDLYRLFIRAMSNITRFEIVNLLKTDGPKTVTEIYESLGFKQSRVSRNLKCLLDCGFVEIEKNGKERLYSLNKDTVAPLIDIIDKHVSQYENHLKLCGVLK